MLRLGQTEPGLVVILRHLTRKWTGSMLTTLEPARGSNRISMVPCGRNFTGAGGRSIGVQ